MELACAKNMLDTEIFKSIVENTPLVSIDMCLICNDQILLGKRNNEPLKGRWFTPGGRIFKNESWQACVKRIAISELGLVIDDMSKVRLMGVWDHFYANSFVDKDISTHYINLPHYVLFEDYPKIETDDQHKEMGWFDLETVKKSAVQHEYMRNYATWLLKADL